MITLDSIPHNQIQKFKDKFEFPSLYNNTIRRPKAYNPKQNEIITLDEGMKILGKGWSGQFKDTLDAIIKNPAKSIAAFAITTAGIMMLPIIGIPSAVGAGALAVGFAAVALGKAVYHGISFANSNKNGSRDIARNNLEQIGRDSFDLTISLPFVPKTLSDIQKFSKYGHIGINKNLINKMSKAKNIYSQYAILKGEDTHLIRHLNFQKALDKELAAINDMTTAEKLKVREELLSYSVPEKELPLAVLEKIAQKEGVTTIPDIGYTSMSEKTQGFASSKSCSITFNDFKNPYIRESYDNMVIISKENIGNTVKATFKDMNTGKIYEETIDIDILNEYNSRCESYKQLTPQAKRILTTIHEREHISQFARLIQMKGFDVIKGLTQRGKQLYEQIINQMPRIETGTQEAIEAESLSSFAINPTILNYIKRPFEIGARRVEFATYDKPLFKKLNKIFDYTNKNSKTSIEGSIIMTDARLESAQN